ncbi:MAG TPA: hypothetical protein VJL80_04080 [Aeromicrobium sp.]|nr:hypothetical protein [Aeromicrobium sp.]HKY57199.1 hypothetical protein [Aeromicrobium sp.]
MRGLTVRWSLAEAPDEALDELRDYIDDVSHARFSALAGLRFKAWRARPGEWFEGTYVFADDAARADFQSGFAVGAADSPVSKILGRAPSLIEPCEVVAVAEGAAGFEPFSRLD